MHACATADVWVTINMASRRLAADGYVTAFVTETSS